MAKSKMGFSIDVCCEEDPNGLYRWLLNKTNRLECERGKITLDITDIKIDCSRKKNSKPAKSAPRKK